MTMRNGCTCLITTLLGLILSGCIGLAYADKSDLCSALCGSDLKQCRSQADSEANNEAHPIFTSGKVTLNRAMNMSTEGPINRFSDAKQSQIEKRKDERYEQCEVANKNCRRNCILDQDHGSEPAHKVNSLVFKNKADSTLK